MKTASKQLLSSGVMSHTQDAVMNAGTMLMKQLFEAMLSGEMNHHLNNEKLAQDRSDEADGSESLEQSEKERTSKRNRRCGYSKKRVRLANSDGEIEVSIPRDRQSTFEPRIIPKHSRRVTAFDDVVINLYAGGMSTREICEFVRNIYNTDISADMVSEITDSILDSVRAWRTRELQTMYPVVFIDAIHVKMRRNGAIRILPSALMRKVGGKCLASGLPKNESASFWQEVFTELQNRGVEDVLLMISDGLSSLTQAIERSFPKTIHQTCIIHLVRNSVTFVNYKDRKKVCDELRKIYTSVNAEETKKRLDEFAESDLGKTYPRIVRIWEAAWEQVVPFFGFPPAVRKMIYTTNMIENLNLNIRKNIKARGAFPTEEAVAKCIWFVVSKVTEKWERSVLGWRNVMVALEGLYGERFAKHVSLETL